MKVDFPAQAWAGWIAKRNIGGQDGVGRSLRQENDTMDYSENKHKLNRYAKEMRKQMTPWEGKLWFMYLRNYPIKFKRQVVMGRYIADFSCNAAKLIVELDGGGHYNSESQKYDEERTKFLEQNGYKVVRVLNSDIDKNLRGVCEFINREVRARI